MWILVVLCTDLVQVFSKEPESGVYAAVYYGFDVVDGHAGVWLDVFIFLMTFFVFTWIHILCLIQSLIIFNPLYIGFLKYFKQF